MLKEEKNSDNTNKNVDVTNKMLFASFNQDGSCFAIGTDTGFKVFNSYPLRDHFERVLEGGIGIVEMLNRCNILALVGGGKTPKYSPNKVIIWDDHQSKVVSELRFTSYVCNVKLKRERLIVVCERKIYLFNLTNFQNMDTIDTFDNNKGLIAVNTDPNSTVIAYPDKNQGIVRVKFYEKEFSLGITAHESHIAAISLNAEGTLLATASDKGTLIRIFNATSSSLLQEVRRGTEKTIIYSIVFNSSSSLIATTSGRGTVHIFSLAGATKKLKDGGAIE